MLLFDSCSFFFLLYPFPMSLLTALSLPYEHVAFGGSFPIAQYSRNSLNVTPNTSSNIHSPYLSVTFAGLFQGNTCIYTSTLHQKEQCLSQGTFLLEHHTSELQSNTSLFNDSPVYTNLFRQFMNCPAPKVRIHPCTPISMF